LAADTSSFYCRLTALSELSVPTEKTPPAFDCIFIFIHRFW